LLSRSDVDPNSKTSRGNTPFLHASITGEGGTAKLFLNLDNFDPNIANNDGRTSLSFAAEFGHIGIVEMLLAMDNIDLNPVDEDSNTPILWAAAGAWYGEIVKGAGRAEIVKLLLDCKGINRNQVNNKEHTLLHMAVKGGREEVVMLLLERGESDLNARDLSGATPL
ncbi:ankyrin, partial [Choiromyces venosus 120613-1]